MHTHHSHSGSYCQHARDTLEDIVTTAIVKKFTLLCLTEHIPRLIPEQLYPEEIESNTSPQDLEKAFDCYYNQAKQLKTKYAGQIRILVGFEAEGLDLEYVTSLHKKYEFDMFVGSLHHVNGIPIDFDKEQWERARNSAGASNEALLEQYFDQQYAMIEALKPSVVGHFDLIRLFAPDHSIPDKLWPRVVRNVRLAVELGCLFEINTSAIRKGWSTPYPQQDIADLIKSENGKFCLSDDSHGVAQIGLNYDKLEPYLERYGPFTSVTGESLSNETLKNWLININT